MFPLINLSSVLMFELEAGCCTGAVCRSHSGKMINDRLVYLCLSEFKKAQAGVRTYAQNMVVSLFKGNLIR